MLTDMRMVAQSDAMATLPELLDSVEQQPVVISREGEQVGALVSMSAFETLRQANIQKLLDLCRETGAELAKEAAERSMSLEELERYLLSNEE